MSFASLFKRDFISVGKSALAFGPDMTDLFSFEFSEAWGSKDLRYQKVNRVEEADSLPPRRTGLAGFPRPALPISGKAHLALALSQ